jgi:hypothetical protein
MDRDVKLTLRIPDDVHRRIVALAKRERRSMNSQITVLLEIALAQTESGRPPSEVNAQRSWPAGESLTGASCLSLGLR